MDVLVEKVQGADDMAVLLLGYEALHVLGQLGSIGQLYGTSKAFGIALAGTNAGDAAEAEPRTG